MLTGLLSGLYRLLYYYTLSGSIKIWDVGAGQELKYYTEKLPAAVRDTEKSGPVLALQFLPHSPDKQRLLVAAGWKNEIRLFSVSIPIIHISHYLSIIYYIHQRPLLCFIAFVGVYKSGKLRLEILLLSKLGRNIITMN